MRSLLAAVQFLTVIPVPWRTAEPWRAAVFFPLVGALLGLAGGGLLIVAEAHLPVHLRTLLVLLFWIWITGALHEDGLADVADGCRPGRAHDRMLEIMRDSRIGTYGGLALLASVLVRWQGLIGLTLDPIPALIAVLTLSRVSIVCLARVARPAGGSMGAQFADRISTPVALVVAAQGAAAALLCGWRAAPAMLAATTLVVILSRWYYHRRLGGITGDCLGATSQFVEMTLFTLLACQSCMW